MLAYILLFLLIALSNLVPEAFKHKKDMAASQPPRIKAGKALVIH